MKKLVLLTLSFALAHLSPAQFSVGAGLGVSSKADILQVKVNYEGNKAGFTGGYITHLDNINPAYFNYEVFTWIPITTNWRVVPHGGGSYMLRNTNEKGGQSVGWIAGVSLENKIDIPSKYDDCKYKIIVWFDGSYTHETLIFTLGARGVISKLLCK